MTVNQQPLSDNVAELIAQEKSEPVASYLHMKLQELSPGYARVSMLLVPEYRNFNGLVFGGIVMALADQAFAYACNALAIPSAATQFNIHFFAAPELGTTLTAECRELKSGRRLSVFEIVVTSQDNKLIAKATGTSVPLVEDKQ